MSRRSLLLAASLLVGGVVCQAEQAASAPASAELAPVAAATAAPTQARVVDINAFGRDERLTVLAIQGIANRKGPRVFLNTGQSVRWNQIDYDRDEGAKSGRVWSKEDVERLKPRYSNTCDYWIEYVEKIGMATFEKATLHDLFRIHADEIKGVILYANVNDDLAIAGTMAGLRDAVPMTEQLYADVTQNLGRELPVIFDVRSLYPSYNPKEERRLAAHRWAIEHLLPECRRNGALSRDLTYGQDAHDTLIDTDLAVHNRWFIFDLSFMAEETRLGRNDKPHPVWGFEPPDKELLVKLLTSLDQPYPEIYGWGRPYESALIRRLAITGGVKIVTGNGNASFFRAMPMQTKNFHQPVPHVEKATLEEKVYVAFATNEGDTLKYLAGLVNGGGWLQSERGRFPINWGMDPLLYRDFPGLVSHYYRTATPNDYFFSGPSGWGYLAPFTLPDERLPVYGELVRKGLADTDLRYIDVWWMNGLRERGKFFSYLESMGARGLTQWSGKQEVEFAPDGTPIIHSNFYYTRNRPEVVAAKLRTVKQTMGKPWFVFIYGGQPHWFGQIAANLPPEDFKIVKLDEFFEAARAARPQLEGRRYEVRPEDITEAP
jgi:hypothetical protein